jgi:hypothetical protein
MKKRISNSRPTMGKEWLSVGVPNVAGRCNSALLTSPETGTVVFICVNGISPGRQERKTVFNTSPNVSWVLKLLSCFLLASIRWSRPSQRMSFGSRLPAQRCSIYVYEIVFGWQAPKLKGVNAGAGIVAHEAILDGRGTNQQEGLVHVVRGLYDGIMCVQYEHLFLSDQSVYTHISHCVCIVYMCGLYGVR